ncbi:MAG: hypothetical protein O7C62_02615 [Rickettsia endosymbiont of Ixodes persulcatus]|nr:hypothetical protein [Rickettsia endosymbiont of Ixodes persulcatus]
MIVFVLGALYTNMPSHIKEKQIKEIISGARNDIRDIESYVLGQLKNQIIASQAP